MKRQFFVLDAAPYDALSAAMAAAPRDQFAREWAAFDTLNEGKFGEGVGAVAPCFDEFDRDAERARGRWYVFDKSAFDAFRKMVNSLPPLGR